MFVSRRRVFHLSFLFLAATLALPAVAVDALEWSLGPEIYGEIEQSDYAELRDSAIDAGVPAGFLFEASGLLFDDSTPDTVPDEIIAKTRLFALTLAQERIVALQGEAGAPSDEEVRASAIAAFAAAECVVTPPDGGGSAVEEYVAPLTSGQEQQMRDYLEALNRFASDLQDSLDEQSTREPGPGSEDAAPDALPERPDFVSDARANYENLSDSDRQGVHEKLRKQALTGFRCEGGGCSSRNCQPDVDFATEEELVEGKPLQMKLRVFAVPRCSCGG